MNKLGFGLMRLPWSDDKTWNNVDIEKTREMIDAYISQGFSYFDTAWVYHGGMSEKIFGELVAKRYPREKFQVTTKMPLWNVKETADFEKIFNQQLANCGVEYFDYYFLHAMNKDLFEKAEKLGGFEFMNRMKAEGKIKHPGFSFHDSPEVLEWALERHHKEVELIQLQINYIDWESNDVASRRCYEIAAGKYNKWISVMEPLKGGNLAKVTPEAEKLLKSAQPDLSIASWGIRYAASLDNVIVVLSGMSNMEQLEDNMSYMKDFKPLSDSEYKAVEKAGEIIKNSILVPCTGCHYCTDPSTGGCPKKIDIPRFFQLYNDQNKYSLSNGLKWNYGEASKNGGSPADCIGCGHCERHCPQKIQIISELKKVKEIFS